MIRRLLASLALVAFASTAQAQYGSTDDVLRAEVLPGWRTPEGTHMAAVRLTLAPGWKTYWRAPGEAGIPPQFDFSGSRNIVAATPHFPVPEVFHASGMRSIGYRDSVVLPLELRMGDALGPARLTARLDLGICEDICMPASVTLRADLPPGATPDPAIQRALAARPVLSGAPLDCDLSPIADGMRVQIRLALPPGLPPDSIAVIEPGDPRIWAADTVTRISGASVQAVTDFVPPYGTALVLDRSAVRVTVLGGDRAVELRGCD